MDITCIYFVGRQFYKCSKRDEGKCNFFLWADEANTGVDSPYSSSHSSYNSQGKKCLNNSTQLLYQEGALVLDFFTLKGTILYINSSDFVCY